MIRKFEKVNKSFNSFKSLPSKVLTKARENSTTKTYSSCFEKQKIWATQFPEVNVLPANEFHIVLYMIHLLPTGKIFPVIRISYFAMNYFHSTVGYQNPCSISLPYFFLPSFLELVNQYFKKGNIRYSCQKYIFRGIITTKSHSKLRTCDKHITYTCVMCQRKCNRRA